MAKFTPPNMKRALNIPLGFVLFVSCIAQVAADLINPDVSGEIRP